MHSSAARRRRRTTVVRESRWSRLPRRVTQYGPTAMMVGSMLAVLVTLTAIVATYTAVSGVLYARALRRNDRTDTTLTVLTNETVILNVEAAALECNTTCCDNFTFATSFPYTTFRVYQFDDATAGIQFDADAVPNNTTVDISIQSLTPCTPAVFADIPTPTNTFSSDVFTIEDYGDPTAEMQWDLSSVPGGTLVTLFPPNGSGTIARTSQVPVVTTIFQENQFLVYDNAAPTAKLAFNVSDQITPGATRTFATQATGGTVAFEHDIPAATNISDSVFGVHSVTNSSAIVRLNLTNITPGVDREMTFQNRSCTILYLEQLPEGVEVLVTTSRPFPSIAFEGVATIAELGNVVRLEVSVCGGGGGGGATLGCGGGSGSGHQDFVIDDPASKFDTINCTVGVGGTGSSGANDATDGTATTAVGITSTGYFVSLTGYGGGAGQDADGGGGGGGGGGGSAVGTTPGVAGSEGGLVGGIDAFPNMTRGGINLTWRSGGAGVCNNGTGADWQGGPMALGSGAASMFSGDSGPPTAGVCAGGAGNPTGAPGVDGGGGACFFRYIIEL